MTTAGSNTVEVFKTNVADEKQALQVEARIRQLFAGHHINFDLEDCDKILRVEGKDVCSEAVITILKGSGFFCERLV